MGGVELVVTLHGRGRACPARRFAWADFCGWLPWGWPLAQGFAGRQGRRPLRFAREWAAAGACPSSGPAGPPSPKGEGKGCSGGIHPSRGVGGSGRSRRGVGDAAPCGLPGNGRLPRLTLPTSPPAYSRCCRRQNRWGRSAHRPHARFRRWIRSRGASGHRRSGPEGTGVCRRCNFSSAG